MQGANVLQCVARVSVVGGERPQAPPRKPETSNGCIFVKNRLMDVRQKPIFSISRALHVCILRALIMTCVHYYERDITLYKNTRIYLTLSAPYRNQPGLKGLNQKIGSVRSFYCTKYEISCVLPMRKIARKDFPSDLFSK